MTFLIGQAQLLAQIEVEAGKTTCQVRFLLLYVCIHLHIITFWELVTRVKLNATFLMYESSNCDSHK